MVADISRSFDDSAEYRADQEEFEGSGQAVRAPEPRGGDPEHGHATSLGAAGRGGSAAQGTAGKSPRRGGVDGPPLLGWVVVGGYGWVAGRSVLDSKENNRNSFCCRYTVHGPADTEKGERWRYSSLKCKSWNCERCGPKKLRRFKSAIIKAAEDNKELRRFLTLTLPHPNISPGELRRWIRHLKDCWNKFRVYLKRKHGESISFISVLELRSKTNALHPHLHLLVDRFIPHKWISEAWQSVGGGKIVVIKQIDVHRIAAYLSKYLTKEMCTDDYPRYTRRFTTSRDIRLFVRGTKGLWEVIRIPIAHIYHRVRDIAENVRHGIESSDELDSFDLLVPLGWELVADASP